MWAISMELLPKKRPASEVYLSPKRSAAPPPAEMEVGTLLGLNSEPPNLQSRTEFAF